MSEEKKKGLFARLFQGLSKTRGNLTDKVDELVESTEVIDEDFYEELTDILIMSDAGVKATDAIIEELQARVKASKTAWASGWAAERISGCHCSPQTNRFPGRYTASTRPSAATACAFRPGAKSRMA